MPIDFKVLLDGTTINQYKNTSFLDQKGRRMGCSGRKVSNFYCKPYSVYLRLKECMMLQTSEEWHHSRHDAQCWYLSICRGGLLRKRKVESLTKAVVTDCRLFPELVQKHSVTNWGRQSIFFLPWVWQCSFCCFFSLLVNMAVPRPWLQEVQKRRLENKVFNHYYLFLFFLGIVCITVYI